MNDTHHSERVHACAPGLGARLRQAREHAGMSRSQLAARMHVLTRIVEDIESDCFERLGADVYIRGHLRSFSREVGLAWSDIEPMLAPSRQEAAPIPIAVAATPRWRANLEAIGHRSVYVTLTVAIVAPIVWLAGSHQLPDTAAPLTLLQPSTRSDAAVAQPAEQRPAVLATASMTPRLPAVVPGVLDPLADSAAASSTDAGRRDESADVAGEWRFVFAEQSWFELYDRDGRRLVHELVPAGAEYRFPEADIGQVALGNAAAVTVHSGADTLDLTRFRQGNVARFAVSSSGEVVSRSSGG